MNENVPLVWKFIIAIASGVFSLAVAISVQHIRIYKMPKWLIFFAMGVQLILSWGVFIFVMLFFKSGLLPESMPNDDWTALVCAYGASTIPHIVITTLIFIYNKEVNKWLESRYGEKMHDMDSMHKRVQEMDAREQLANTNALQSEYMQTQEESEESSSEASEEKKLAICEKCGQPMDKICEAEHV